jgi:hypothetical protein
VVKAFDPSWLSRPVAELSAEAGVRPERVSRLWRRLLAPMENLLGRASTRGRKKKGRPSEPARRLLRAETLLEVAREVIRLGGPGKRRVQDLLVAARDRLKEEHGISCAEFCRTLGLPARTVRSWARRGVAAPKEEEPKNPPPPAGDRREGRFDLAVTLPGLQALGDTTNLTVFGVPLKLVALQDPGARHERPWEAFAVDTEENHRVVLDVVRSALSGKPGVQFLVDQGTPYMAEATRDTLEDLDLFHEPQKEGTPTEKATLERSFGVVKSCLAPILSLTGKLADLVPALRSEELAKAAGRLLLAAYLQVYATASRARETRRPDDPQVLAAIAEAQRERAVAEHRSAKLLLEAVFDRYGFEGSKRDFVRAHRHHFVEDVEEAERRLALRAAGGGILHWERYFSAILQNVREGRREARKRQAWERRRAARQRSEAEKERRRRAAREAAFDEDPVRRIASGLSLVARHYRPERDDLFNGGVGPGTRRIRKGLAAVAERAPAALADHATSAWRAFLGTAEDPRPLPAVRAVLDRLLAEAKRPAPSPDQSPSAILFPGSHRNRNPRPPPEPDLRNSAARSGET